MIIDSHCHINFQAFDLDRDQKIKETLDKDVWMINIGSQYDTSKKAIEIAEKNEKGVYASVGLHPIHTVSDFFEKGEVSFNVKDYKDLAKSDKVVAIGEIGLDYYYKPKGNLSEFKKRQEKIFRDQIEMAIELNLPIVFHCRSAHKDMIEILKEYNDIKGVVHCFTGKVADVKEYLNIGLYIGFTGIIFKLNLREAIKKVPLERMLVETDSPYLSPPGRSERNEPLYVIDVAKEVARIKEVDFNLISEITTENTRRLFNI
jgi:TatD DNase family protein